MSVPERFWGDQGQFVIGSVDGVISSFLDGSPEFRDVCGYMRSINSVALCTGSSDVDCSADNSDMSCFCRLRAICLPCWLFGRCHIVLWCGCAFCRGGNTMHTSSPCLFPGGSSVDSCLLGFSSLVWCFCMCVPKLMGKGTQECFCNPRCFGVSFFSEYCLYFLFLLRGLKILRKWATHTGSA